MSPWREHCGRHDKTAYVSLVMRLRVTKTRRHTITMLMVSESS
jgi:hypothetical protein